MHYKTNPLEDYNDSLINIVCVCTMKVKATKKQRLTLFHEFFQESNLQQYYQLGYINVKSSFFEW